ncbi:PMEL protein, partial [Polyodon spathula]|nr:PMEL protein [Polyodon spathula]
SLSLFLSPDQIPFSVSLSQVNDLNQADQSFIQNRAVSFTVHLHDPSQYLSSSDITFNWDFGDNSGTLISRGLAVTHTYLTAGSFQPLVLLQATIPVAGCVTPGDPLTPGGPTGSAGLVSSEPATRPLGTTASSASVAPVVVSTPGPDQTSNPADQDLAVSGSAAAPAAGEDSVAVEASVAPAAAGGDGVAEAVASVAPVDAVDTVAPMEAVDPIETVAPDTVALAASVAPVEAVDPMNTVVPVAETVAPGVAQASTSVAAVEELVAVTPESAEGIESVEIVQVQNVELEAQQNAVDLTITCQGSVPSEVCTVISDADCAVPVLTACNAVPPSPECQLVLRQIFNETGVFCVNVSMTNSVSLAMTSTRVNINAASGSSTAATVVLIVGMLSVASAVGAVVFTYR